MTDLSNTKHTSIEIRSLKFSDFKELTQSMKEAYQPWTDVSWTEEQIHTLIKKFPKGQFVVLVDGKVVGSALSLIVDYEKFGDEHTYMEITGNDSFDTHDPKGSVLYGIGVFIHEEFRGIRIRQRLYDAWKHLSESLNLRAIIFGGRIPGYCEYDQSMNVKEYIQKVRNKEIQDSVLNFQLSNDFHVKKIIKHYMPGEVDSRNYAILLQWDNIYYQKPDNKNTGSPHTDHGVVRIGLVQWQMRSYSTLEGVFEQIENYVNEVSGYQSDFVLFPEYFITPLMTNFNDLPEAGAIRKLAQYTEEVKNKFSQLAINYNINIIAGSMPQIRDNQLYNVGFLCHRDGRTEQYEKLHITPGEVKSWGLKGGSHIQTYDTDCGKIGILICYDVEFPELARTLAEEGMQLLFVPLLTGTQNGYSRVRHCAQARAIENECYVAIAGSVGNLPSVVNMNTHYAQAAVFTPCDFSFPANGIKAEATPNTEMILIADLDLDLLQQLHHYGSVRNLKNRRKDLYALEFHR